MRLIVIIGIIVTGMLSACSKRSLQNLRKQGVQVHRSQSLAFAQNASDTVRMQYLGCGGFYIRHGQQSILIDPFFSHQRFMRIGRSLLVGSKVWSKPGELAYGKRMIRDSLKISDAAIRNEIKGIFVAHGHYDHLMDVPYIFHEWTDRNAMIFANASAAATCANVIPAAKFTNVEAIASVRNQQGDSIAFNDQESTIRVYPIFANHNPHSRNVKLFAGSTQQSPEHFKSHRDKTKVNDWLEGQTLSFLIDFVVKDSVKFRMFIQSSSCEFPHGMPPDDLLKQKAVDLAVLGVASYHFSENSYPCQFLDKLKPQRLMFIHWEDFFRMLRQPTKTVRKNNVSRFFTKIFAQCAQDYIMPLPGSVITVTY